MKNEKSPPWEHENPKSEGEHKKLTPAGRAEAKKAAEKAGRPYPNLVDNMREARKPGKAKPAKR
jgi:hypothetical protein